MKIKEFSKKCNISCYTIRFYEQEGLFSGVARKNSYRDFTDKDIERIRKITILRKLGVPIPEIKMLFDVLEKPNLSIEEINLIKKQQNVILENIEHLNHILNDMNDILPKETN